MPAALFPARAGRGPPTMTDAADPVAKYGLIALNGQTMIARFTTGRQCIRRFAAGLALLGLIARALIPLGYMPGNLLAGEFMVLCPSGLPANLAHALHDHHDAATVTVEADRACPIGAALTYAAMPTEAVPTAATALSQSTGAIEPESLLGSKPLRLFQVRAPPTVKV